MTLRALTLASLMLLTACASVGESRLNPFNWFGRSEEAAPLTTAAVTEVRDDRPLIPFVTDVTIARRPGGAILTATGLPNVQGWYDVALVGEADDLVAVEGVLTLAFRGRPPLQPERVSTARSREVVAGVFLDDRVLVGVRRIQVVAATNARVISR